MILYLNTSQLNKIEFRILSGRKILSEYSAFIDFHESYKILSHLEKFLKKQPKNYQLKAISLYAGSGSFTGLRVGAAIAKALSLAWKIPLRLNRRAPNLRG